MAAHVVTALHQIKNNPESWDNLQCALDFSCWTELLDTHDYVELQRIVTVKSLEDLTSFINLMIPKYTNKWYSPNCPDNMYDWVNAEYNQVVVNA